MLRTLAPLAMPSAALWLQPSRALSQTCALCKGHAKWQNIMHIKKDNDRKYAMKSLKYVARIEAAIRNNGNQGDPKLNRPLQVLIDEALKDNIRRETITNAIKRASSKDASDLQEYHFGVRGPGQCAILVEALAPNRRTVEMKLNTALRRKHGYKEDNLLSMFDPVGVVVVGKGTGGLDSLEAAEELAIECDAEEVEEAQTEEGTDAFEFSCDSRQVQRLRGALEKAAGADLAVLAAEARYLPNSTTKLGKKTTAAVLELIEEIHEQCPQVVAVHHNVEGAAAKTEESAS